MTGFFFFPRVMPFVTVCMSFFLLSSIRAPYISFINASNGILFSCTLHALYISSAACLMRIMASLVDLGHNSMNSIIVAVSMRHLFFHMGHFYCTVRKGLSLRHHVSPATTKVAIGVFFFFFCPFLLLLPFCTVSNKLVCGSAFFFPLCNMVCCVMLGWAWAASFE